MFANFIARWRPVHVWSANSSDEQRTCQICGLVEHYAMTDGWVAPAWRAVVPGDKFAHTALVKAR